MWQIDCLVEVVQFSIFFSSKFLFYRKATVQYHVSDCGVLKINSVAVEIIDAHQSFLADLWSFTRIALKVCHICPLGCAEEALCLLNQPEACTEAENYYSQLILNTS